MLVAMTIGTNLRRLRLDAGLTQPQLAKKAGVSQQLVSQLEQDKNASTKYLPRLAAALNVTVDEIDPNFVPGSGSRSSVLAEIGAIYDRLEDYPQWQEYLLDQARQLESRVLGQETQPAPSRATGSK